ncbi:GDP-mannose 4,6-dehydratase [Spirochaetota bacterium]
MEHIVITGGLGFIGVNTAIRFMEKGKQVVLIDNMGRKGTKTNYEHLCANYKGKFSFERTDIRDFKRLSRIFRKYSAIRAVFHFAAQVAVTTSVLDPREDFESNALGTFNVLECIRLYAPAAPIIFSSTNKVYGGFENVRIVEKDGRYAYADFPQGISEDTNLDFHSPYGCSKGAADQYIHDYNRIYNVKSIVYRQSCIYGIHQFGIEDQGWVAWFTIASVLGKPITIYGNGRQARDVLFIDDLTRLYEQSLDCMDTLNGGIYNIGGGAENVMSLLELVAFLEKFLEKKIPYKTEDWRPGDQKVYISNIAKIKKDIGWEPLINVEKGVEILYKWIIKNRDMLLKALK